MARQSKATKVTTRFFRRVDHYLDKDCRCCELREYDKNGEVIRVVTTHLPPAQKEELIKAKQWRQHKKLTKPTK